MSPTTVFDHHPCRKTSIRRLTSEAVHNDPMDVSASDSLWNKSQMKRYCNWKTYRADGKHSLLMDQWCHQWSLFLFTNFGGFIFLQTNLWGQLPMGDSSSFLSCSTFIKSPFQSAPVFEKKTPANIPNWWFFISKTQLPGDPWPARKPGDLSGRKFRDGQVSTEVLVNWYIYIDSYRTSSKLICICLYIYLYIYIYLYVYISSKQDTSHNVLALDQSWNIFGSSLWCPRQWCLVKQWHQHTKHIHNEDVLWLYNIKIVPYIGKWRLINAPTHYKFTDYSLKCLWVGYTQKNGTRNTTKLSGRKCSIDTFCNNVRFEGSCSFDHPLNSLRTKQELSTKLIAASLSDSAEQAASLQSP